MFKLICFDMDGVIFEPENFWMDLHKALGTYEKGVELTKKYRLTDYNKLVEEVVVKLWKGKDAKAYFDLVNSVKYLKGVKETFSKLKDFQTAIISSGSIDLARRAEKDLGVKYVIANELVIKDRKISGEFVWPIGAGTHKKVEAINNLCKDLNISPKEIIFIGDSITDIEAFRHVGKSIAFNSDSEELKKAATHVVEGNDLRKILKYI